MGTVYTSHSRYGGEVVFTLTCCVCIMWRNVPQLKGRKPALLIPKLSYFSQSLSVSLFEFPHKEFNISLFPFQMWSQSPLMFLFVWFIQQNYLPCSQNHEILAEHTQFWGKKKKKEGFPFLFASQAFEIDSMHTISLLFLKSLVSANRDKTQGIFKAELWRSLCFLVASFSFIAHYKFISPTVA